MVLATAVIGAGASVRSAVGQAASQNTGSVVAPDLAGVFAEGEAALRVGELGRAEGAFRKVLAADPGAAGAYANLGVIAMRRQQWGQALELLQKAQRLAPGVAGIRLNIGLVFYRQNDFH